MTQDDAWREATKSRWKDIIYKEDGTLDEDAVLAELYDFQFVAEQASEVYCEITGGALSKPTYYASGVLSAHSDYIEDLLKEARREAAKDALDMWRKGATIGEIMDEFS